ncbi:MAG: hypothetical protein JRN20_00620 [Nitrososphaerota archaeon]|jgi:cytoskeletal protein CcmA (bactofilin family)|nr:hypothetical protein [Nitrososphaerota archaeon]MDG6922147.1 hypothetical protein [Nitrososphaerota archaeon]
MTEHNVSAHSVVTLENVEGNLRVGRNARLESHSGKITVTGNMYFEGGADVNCSLECDMLRVDHFGVVRIAGDLTVHSELDIIHSIEVSGAVNAGAITGEGKIHSDSIMAKKIRANGLMEVKTKLIAEQAVLTGEADIAGRIEVSKGLKAKSVIIRSGSSYEQPIIAETVDVGESYANINSFQTDWMGQNISMRLIGRESRVNDMYATNVHLNAVARAGKIFGQNIQLEKGCIVDQIAYIGELQLPDSPKDTYIHHPPEKVEKLPDPPL